MPPASPSLGPAAATIMPWPRFSAQRYHHKVPLRIGPNTPAVQALPDNGDKAMNNGEPEIRPGNPTEVPPEKIPPDILPGEPIEVPEPSREIPPEPPLEVPPSPPEI